MQPKDKKLRKYHLRLVALMAACAEGDSKYIESMCHTIFDVDEILGVLNNKKVPNLDKAAYLRFAALRLSQQT